MYTLLIIWLGKVVLFFSRLRGGSGSALPGLLAEKLHPKLLTKLGQRLGGGSIVVTGTNGKTTTTKLVAGIVGDSGQRVLSNRAGSNMSRGVVSTLIEHADLFGRLPYDIGLFEVDEAFVEQVAKSLQPRVIVVLNLLRDQLDRYGELDRTAQLISSGLVHAQAVVLNRDDPLVAGMADKLGGQKIIWFGATARLQVQLPDDASLLSRTKKGLAKLFNTHGVDDILLTHCEEDANKQRIEFKFGKRKYRAGLAIPGVYNAYNAVAALAVVSNLPKIDFNQAVQSISEVTPAFGRAETIEIDGKSVRLLLVKNPSGFNQVIQTFLAAETQLPVLIAINDNFADGRDVSWLWDVDFERMRHQHNKVLASGTRASDLALRLKYADIESTIEPSLKKALHEFVATLPKGKVGYIVPTYTAMTALRKMMARRTQLDEVYK